MKIVKNYLTKNKCYQKAMKLNPTGIMLHSTACPGAMAKNFLKSWNVYQPNGNSVCVHGFLDNSGFYQTLPWTYVSWHCGGSGNNTHIGFEICEPKNYADKKYFETVKNYAIELCVYLIKQFNLKYSDITSHCEGYRTRGKSFASNHSDLDHWWKKYHNYTMDNFREDVRKKLEEGDEEEMIYNTIEEIPDWGRATIKKLIEKGTINGDGKNLALEHSVMKTLVILDRAGIFDK